ncbi:MAG TPA: META domain-containing protein [Candidatus Limnocylindria bacterium]|nr:META domain-containing protein [Candidatus Limnocylindria bacterium]
MPRTIANHPTVAVLTRIVFALGLFAIIAGAAGCQTAGSLGLAERDFLSVAVKEGGAARALVAGTRIRLHLGDSELGASAGCNSMGGTYRIEGGRLVFEGGAMTEMGCDPERHAQDDWLATFLSSKPALRLANNDLILDGGATVIQLVDREVAEPDLNIVGPTWTLESIIAGDSVSSVPEGARATLLFKADGTVDVFAGCNQGSGTWAATGTGITFGPLTLTKRACQDPGAAVESEVVTLLGQGSVAATIDASRLTLQSGGRGLAFTGG